MSEPSKTLVLAMEQLGEWVLSSDLQLHGARSVLLTSDRPGLVRHADFLLLREEAGWRREVKRELSEAKRVIALAGVEEWRRGGGTALAAEVGKVACEPSVLVLAADPMRPGAGLPGGLAAELIDFARGCFDIVVWDQPPAAEQLKAAPLQEFFAQRGRRAARLVEHLAAFFGEKGPLPTQPADLKWAAEGSRVMVAGLSQEEATDAAKAARSAVTDLQRRPLPTSPQRLMLHLLVSKTLSLQQTDQAVRQAAEPLGLTRGDLLLAVNILPRASAPRACLLAPLAAKGARVR